MIICLLILQALLCSLLLYREVVQKRFRNFATSLFYAVYAVLYVAEPLVLHFFFGGARSIVRGEDNVFPDEGAYIVFNMLGLVLLFSSLVASLGDDAGTARGPHHVPWAAPAQTANLLGLLLVLGLALFVYASGSSLEELLVSARFSWFEEEGFNVGLSVASAYMFALTPIYLYLVLTKAPYQRWILLLALAALLTYGVITKDRKWIFFAASGWLAARYHLSGCQLRLGWKASLGIAALFVAVLLSQFIRDALPRYLLNEEFDPAEELYSSVSYLFEYSDLSYFYRATVEAIHQNLDNGFSITFGIVRRTLLFFVPAGLSGGLKVEDISAIFSDVVGGEDALRRGSMPPGLFGLFVLSFGWAASLVVMPLLALGLARLDRLFKKPGSILQVCLITSALTSIVFAFRGDESTAFYFPIVNLVALALLTAFLHSLKPRPALPDRAHPHRG